MPFQIKEFNGAEALDVVTSLYSTEGGGIEIRESDLFFVGFQGGEIVGSVRFCVEHQTPMLRTMRIAKSFQRRGYGLMLLKHFESFLDRNQIGPTYCLPYGHLESFYRQIGFEIIDPKFAPEFLRKRLLDYQSRAGSFLLMYRPTLSEKTSHEEV